MSGIYIHIPFCKQACNYCNFHFSTSLRQKPDLIAAIRKEIELRQHFFEDKRIQTIYFGGGTPSLLNIDELNSILETLAKYYDLSTVQEFTLEANPDDLNATYLRQLKHIGFNRLSIGVQSFFDNDLKTMRRAHNAHQSYSAIEESYAAGFDNLSIDLIYGLPDNDLKDWEKNLEIATKLRVPHLSAYALTVEPQTLLAHQVKKKSVFVPPQDEVAEQFDFLMNYLREKNYNHYEISNFSQIGKEAIHNTNYWTYVPYLGIGPSAHSYKGNIRAWNVANNQQYITSLLQNNNYSTEEEILDLRNQFNEYVMISLRTQWGIEIKYIMHNFGKEFADIIITQVNNLRIEWFEISPTHIRLSQAGKHLADYITTQLFC